MLKDRHKYYFNFKIYFGIQRKFNLGIEVSRICYATASFNKNQMALHAFLIL